MSIHESVTERSLYPVILDLVKHISSEAGIKVTGASEVKVSDRYPDIILQLDSYKLLVQVKIDGLQRVLDDLVKTYPIATEHNAGLLLLLLPSEVRRVHPVELEKVIPLLQVNRAVMLAPWISKHVEKVTLENVLRIIIDALKQYKKVLKPSVDYLTIAYVAREAVEELAGVLRKHILAVPRLLNQAQAIVGRFDFYRALLSEAVEEEEVMNTYIADIIAYLTILYLLFIHIASIKKYGYTILPRIENPLQPPQNLLDNIINSIKGSTLVRDYSFIAEPSIYILELLKNVEEVTRFTLARYIYAIQTLKPEHVKEELFGRIYQESIPPETRKNLGAFFTNPVAARILAYLAIEKWDDRVLDPACGSGTLLASAYEAKMEKALAQGIDRRKAHELFVKEHIVGIDIMQFAKSLTSVNLALQEVEASVEPTVLWGDGIEKMVSAIKMNDDPPQQTSLYDYIVRRDQEKYSGHLLPREGFDVVIMNPPFTRRERIPENERERLEKILGKVVKGKVGYWAYFFAASDNVIKNQGKLAAVTPEEFFVGSSAESVRRYLLLGEIVGKPKTSGRVYVPVYIVKSVRQVAFSEGASYKDYLVVLRKVSPQEASPCTVIVLLKKKLEELKGKEREIADAVRRFAEDREQVLRGGDFDAVKLGNIAEVVRARIGNLKPLVAFYTVEAYRLYDRVARELSELPTLGNLELRGLIQIRNYNPGQFTARGKHVEDYATRLFIRRYGSRGKVVFDLERVERDALLLKAVRTGTTIRVEPKDVVPALRSVAGVRYLDLTDREEYALVNPNAINPELFRSLGLVDYGSFREAAKDIRDAYDRYSGEILLVRRFRVTSPNVYFIALYSSNRMLSPATMNILRSRNLDKNLMKALALYLNSTLALFQLLSLFVETEGAWVRFDKDVWADIHVPDLEALANNPKTLEEASRTFDKAAKASETLQPLYERISSGSEVQKEIDRTAIKMLGLAWDNEVLNTLYKTIKSELDALQHISEDSQRGRKGRKVEESEDENGEVKSKQKSLTEWIK
jgi:predicted RNA methylase